MLVLLISLALAGAPPRLSLPAGASPGAWSTAATLAGFTLVAAGEPAAVELRTVGGAWYLHVAGSDTKVPIPPPETAEAREDVLRLARSLVRKVASAPPMGPGAASPTAPVHPEAPPSRAAASPTAPVRPEAPPSRAAASPAAVSQPRSLPAPPQPATRRLAEPAPSHEPVRAASPVPLPTRGPSVQEAAAPAPPVAATPPVAAAPPVVPAPPVAATPPVAVAPPVAATPPAAPVPPVATTPPVAAVPPTPPETPAPPPPIAAAPPTVLPAPATRPPPPIPLTPWLRAGIGVAARDALEVGPTVSVGGGFATGPWAAGLDASMATRRGVVLFDGDEALRAFDLRVGAWWAPTWPVAPFAGLLGGVSARVWLEGDATLETVWVPVLTGELGVRFLPHPRFGAVAYARADDDLSATFLAKGDEDARWTSPWQAQAAVALIVRR